MIERTAALLALIGTFEPSRDMGDSTLLAWDEVIGASLATDEGFTDAQAAVRDYYATETWPIKPGHIVEGIARVARRRARETRIDVAVAANTISSGRQSIYNLLTDSPELRGRLASLGADLRAGRITDQTRLDVADIRAQAGRQLVVQEAETRRALAALRGLTE